jgi:hypothetical protein
VSRVVFAALTVLAAVAVVPPATADRADEIALAQQYAPVVRLVAHRGSCGPGKPYQPIDVNALFGEPTVALKGPWGGSDVVKIGPTAKDLAGLYEYHLDFPGNALDPGCGYIRWERRLTADREPTVYAHVATDPAFPGKLALQYWLFYVFNDWNNLHEGDWEMIQLNFDASTPAQALRQGPVDIGYSQHEGAERAAWTDDKLERVDGTHPVVHPAYGSHANFYGEALYLGSSASEGVGCDDTRGPTFDVRPVVKTIPSDEALARAAFPWISFEGRWGELQPAFFNGPTGPNLKTQWTEPIRWSENWRARSYTVSAAGAFGPTATSAFCAAVGGGSRALVQFVHHPLEVGLLLGGLALLLLFLLSRTTWHSTAPLRLARRRAWGQVLTSATRMYRERIPLWVGIGALLLPISLLVALLQLIVLHATSIVGVQTGGESNGFLAFFVLAIGTALTLLGFGVVVAATARALVEIDSNRPIGVLRAYRLAYPGIRALFGALVVAALVISLLTSSIFLLPIAVWLAGRWALLVPAVAIEHVSSLRALRRSRRLVRGRWFEVATLIVAGGALALLAGPVVGVLLILLTDAPFWLANVVAGVLYAVTMPLVALTSVYVYFDARVRVGTDDEPALLPAEIEFSI